MLKDKNESDFYELRIIGSNRLSPDSIPVFFWGALIYSGAITAVVKFATGYSVYITGKAWPMVVKINLILLAIQFLITIFFSNIRNVYKFQKLEALLLSIISLKISVEAYQVFFLAHEDRHGPEYIKNAAILLFIGGVVYLLFSIYRGIKLDFLPLRRKCQGLKKNHRLKRNFYTGIKSLLKP